MSARELTRQRLLEVLDYDPATGVMVWKPRGMPNVDTRLVGTVASSADKDGYRCIRIDKRQYKAHRLAWLYVYGRWPMGQIDHIDHDRANNRISNLREVDYPENGRNQSGNSRSASGHLGVSLNRRTNRWIARIRYNQKCINLGTFRLKDDAVKARKDAEIRLGFHPNHGAALRELMKEKSRG